MPARKPLVFGSSPRPASAEHVAPAGSPGRRPLVFDAEAPEDAPQPLSFPSRPRKRRYREPDFSLLEKGRCPYCSARLKFEVVAEEPVFEEVASPEEDGIGLSSTVGFRPTLIRATCPVCRRGYEFRRYVRGEEQPEFEVYLSLARSEG